LGKKKITYIYNPENPPKFNGGLSCNFGGAQYQPRADLRDDVVSVYTEPFAENTVVQGKMKAKLTVSSDCEDTCFYARISIEKPEGDFPLRDDITSLVYQLGDYTPNTKVKLDFTFDEHYFLIKQGERLRIDISSANKEHYVPHTNNKGLYSIQTKSKTARNTVYLNDSVLVLPVE
jgi:predicted acyl esterase